MSGSLCISIDLELAWGIWDRPDRDYYARCAELERRIVTRLLELFAEREIQATWAIVGRLLERDDGKARETTHGERIWYAPDLIDAVKSSRVSHDIGSHTYAHLYFQEASRSALEADLRAARELHAAHGLPFSSFVFPRNQVGHLDLLEKAGIRVYRSTDRGWFITARERLGRTAGRIAHLVDKALPVTPSLVSPKNQGTLVELPSSMLLLGRKGLRAIAPAQILRAKARRALDAASKQGECFHLWFHPSNFYWDTDRQLDLLAGILDDACVLRDRGALGVRTMSSYAA